MTAAGGGARCLGAGALVTLVVAALACHDARSSGGGNAAASNASAGMPGGSVANGPGGSGTNDAAVLAQLPDGDAVRPANCGGASDVPAAAPWASGRSTGAKDTVPLMPGLTVVTAVAGDDGDYESMKTVETVSGTAITLIVSSEKPQYDPITRKSTTHPLLIRREVSRADQDTACGFMPSFRGDATGSLPTERFPGTTGVTFSTRLLAALKSGQPQTMRMLTFDFGDYEDVPQTVRRIGTEPVQVPVILNDTSVMLPAVRVQCDSAQTTLDGPGGEAAFMPCEYLILDDAADPIVLVWRTMEPKHQRDTAGDNLPLALVNGVLPLDTTQVQVVQIEYAGDAAGASGGSMSGAANGMDAVGGAGAAGGAGVGAAGGREGAGGSGTTAAAGAGTAGSASGAGGVGGVGGAGGGAGGSASGSGGSGGAGAGAAGAGAAAQESRAQESRLEQALAKRDTVVIYGIYFDFAQSNIRQESRPVLRQIAHVMQRNPTWTLAVNGYTDSIGGHPYNLALSQRRAAAVKDSLVSGYHVAAARLTTAGFGDAFPVDSNATLAGRARNRRVELIRH